MMVMKNENEVSFWRKNKEEPSYDDDDDDDKVPRNIKESNFFLLY